MARFRRRKPKVLWLPVVGNDVSDIQEEENFVNGPSGVISVPHDGQIIFDAVPVTFDYTDSPEVEQGDFSRSLQDLTSGNNYRLRRIVGKIHAASTMQSNSNTQYPLIECAAGFIVNRTDDSGNLIGSGGFGNEQAASPLGQNAAQDPWIWRRKWMFGYDWGPYIDSTGLSAFELARKTVFPNSTAKYGSVADGPHIDQKTARVISNQERLFFWIAARTASAEASATQFNLVSWWLDIRIVASLRMNQGNRRNASR